MADSRVTAFRQPKKRRGRARHRPVPYRASEFAVAYVLCLVGTVALFVVAIPLGMLAYVACGLGLSRFISHRVIWLKQRASIENVYRSKLEMFLKWPVTVPVFIWKLTVTKIL